MPDKPTSQFTAITTLVSADRVVAYEASESELRTVTGTVILAWLGASLDMSTIASGGALPVARGGTGITSFGAGVATFLGTPSSANLLAAVTDETGTGALVFANSPTLVTPALGTPASGVLTNCTGLPVEGGGTGRATGTTAYALIATGTTATGAQQSLAAGATTEILVGGGASALPVWTAATGSGAPVRATSPTLTTPVLGVASATSLACPTFTTVEGAMGFTPAAGSNFNITLSGAGDFAVNTNQLYVDTSAGNVGIGVTSPNYKTTIDDPTGNYFALALLCSSIGTPGNWIGQIYGYTGNTYQKAATIFESMDSNARGKFHIALNDAANSDNVTLSDSKVTVLYTGNVGIGIAAPTALMHLGASTTARASLCIPSGTAPTSPVNGDIWSDGSNLLVRLGGTTYTLTKS